MTERPPWLPRPGGSWSNWVLRPWLTLTLRSASCKDVLSCRKSHLPPSFALTQAVLEEASEINCSYVFHTSKEFWAGNDPGPRSHTRSGVQPWAGPGTPASQGTYSIHPGDGSGLRYEGGGGRWLIWPSLGRLLVEAEAKETDVQPRRDRWKVQWRKGATPTHPLSP